jgi:hypothetical protein
MILQPGELLDEVLLPVKLTNRNYQQNSWTTSAGDKRKLGRILQTVVGIREPFEEPVILEVVRILGPNERFWDMDSGLRGNAKELIDVCVQTGWFHDDSPKWIKQVVFTQDSTQRESGCAVLLRMFRVKKES